MIGIKWNTLNFISWHSSTLVIFNVDLETKKLGWNQICWRRRVLKVTESSSSFSFLYPLIWIINSAIYFTFFSVLSFNEKVVEINRIVELPLRSLEEDMLDILSGNDYKTTYFH